MARVSGIMGGGVRVVRAVEWSATVRALPSGIVAAIATAVKGVGGAV